MNLRHALGKKRFRYLLFGSLLLGILYAGWTQLTRTRGAQVVSFTAANRECDVAGQLRYCVFTDPGGTNGDIVYHLHGRNPVSYTHLTLPTIYSV